MKLDDLKFMCTGRKYEPSAKTPVAVMMSGGVDSTVTAIMLKEQGYDVVGVTMQIPSALTACSCGVELRACCGTGASEAARQIGISHYFLDVRDEFRRLVIDNFRECYRNGLTPSPCIDCNTYIKFGVLVELVKKYLGIDRVATGHYARIVEQGGIYGLYTAADPAKDQSYFLYGIRREMLPRILFPLGGQTKQKTREMAKSLGVTAADRPESQELCFAGQGDYRDALGRNPDAGPGDVLDTAGKAIGRHEGIAKYTIGQRSGLGIAGKIPTYIVEIDPARNVIVLGDKAAAMGRTVHANRINALVPELLTAGAELFGRIRSRSASEPCRVTAVSGEGITIEFEEKRHGITPGQHLVLYSSTGQVIAGGEITR